MTFLEKPNLPNKKVILAACAAGYIEEALRCRGIRVVAVHPHPGLTEPVAAHADLQIHDLGGGQLVCAGGEELTAVLENEGFRVEHSSIPLSAHYPGDIPLCCFALDGVLYCHPAYTAPRIKACYREIAPVKQGYARCSVCVVDEKSIITADKGIAAAAAGRGIDVLRIRPGHIELPGYDTGFIGGCSGKLNRDLLAFTGTITLHPDGERIQRFCASRGVEITALENGPLLDIGGILPLLTD